MDDKPIIIGIYTIRQQDILPTDFNRNRWYLYRTIDGVEKQIGRHKTQKQAILATKA